MPQNRPQEAAARLAEIDALQDDVLRRLDELERRTEAVLASCGVAPATGPADCAPLACTSAQTRAA